MADKEVGLKEYLLNREVDFMVVKPKMLDDGERLAKAATAWTTNEEGIRVILEHRMEEIREEILLTCTPYELLSLRDRLAELATIIEDFDKAVTESAKRAEKREEEAEEEPPKEEEEEPADDKSSM